MAISKPLVDKLMSPLQHAARERQRAILATLHTVLRGMSGFDVFDSDGFYVYSSLTNK
jgi:hypothetical protein